MIRQAPALMAILLGGCALANGLFGDEGPLCADNPNACAEHESRGRDCACLGTCASGFVFEEGRCRPEVVFDPVAVAERFVDAQCAFAMRCEPGLYGANQWSSSAECRASTLTFKTEEYRRFQPAIEAGRVAFDPGAFETCLATMAEVDCLIDSFPDADCQSSFLRGTRAPDQPCLVDEECIAGFGCFSPAFGECGTCRAKGAAGQGCVPGSCVDGLLCAHAEEPICVGFARGVGTECGSSAQNAFCAGQLQCVGTTDLRCALPRTLGQSCDPTRTTEAACNLFVGQACDSDGGCREVAWNGAQGRCDRLTELCALGFVCESEVGCVPPPEAGSRCFNGLCADDARCDEAMSPSMCEAKKSSGEACADLDECLDPLFCVSDGSSRTCQTFVWRECG